MVFPIIACSDMQRSIAYYTDKLGFNLTMSMPGESGPSFAIVQLGAAMVALSADPSQYERGKGVVFMIYVAEDADLDAYYADVKARGVAIAEPIADQYWGDRSFTVLDPDGYVLSLCKTVKQMSPDEIAAAAQG